SFATALGIAAPIESAGSSLFEVPNAGAADAAASSGNSLAPNVYHVTANPYAASSILDNGIDPAFLNPNARFGSAFYVAEQPNTALAELANYNAEPFMAINFSTNSGAANVLDLTNPDIASAWGYQGGPITPATQSIGSQASAQGYNVIQYYSVRAPGAVNYAVLNNYNDILTPVAISPAKP
ncbi:RES family NAD+ phosphorylase, partial [Metallibacterium sp.]